MASALTRFQALAAFFAPSHTAPPSVVDSIWTIISPTIAWRITRYPQREAMKITPWPPFVSSGRWPVDIQGSRIRLWTGTLKLSRSPLPESGILLCRSWVFLVILGSLCSDKCVSESYHTRMFLYFARAWCGLRHSGHTEIILPH